MSQLELPLSNRTGRGLIIAARELVAEASSSPFEGGQIGRYDRWLGISNQFAVEQIPQPSTA
jgi:hypothetical protein